MDNAKKTEWQKYLNENEKAIFVCNSESKGCSNDVFNCGAAFEKASPEVAGS